MIHFKWQFIPESGSLTAEGVIETNSVCKRHLVRDHVSCMRGVRPGNDGGVGEESLAIQDLVKKACFRMMVSLVSRVVRFNIVILSRSL